MPHDLERRHRERDRSLQVVRPGYDEWYVRWYAKYEAGAIQWHHTGNWFGGYAPATP